jgi:filamentous hemagglutinin
MTTVPYTFGNESSPIPLSQLDANFAVNPQYANTAGNVVNAVQANITSVGTLTALSVSGNVNSGNLRTAGAVSATGNIAAGNIATGGTVSAFGTVSGGNLTTTGNVTGGNLLTSGRVSATGNITGGNITTAGQISAQGNITAQGIVSAIGNIVTNANFVGNFLGNITGNLSVGGSNTQVLFNNNGNVGAAGGLTYNSGSNTLTVLGTISSQGNVNVGGILAVTGIATVPTAPNATSNNQVASTAFVNNQINQNANNVAITGGNITANTIGTTNWTIKEISNTLYFQFSGSNVAKLDSSGNFTTIGNVTGFGTI